MTTDGLIASIEVHPSDNERGSYVLTARQRLPAPVSTVFPFFAEPENLEAITPPWLCFRILTPLPVVMRQGTLIDYRLRLRGLPIRWRTEISHWDPPHCFVDTQLRGPYRKWIHKHTFVETDGGTLMEDRVEYRVPLSWLTNRLFVKRDLVRIFEYRRQVLQQRFR